MKVTTPAYARMLGCTTRSIVRLIDRGLPAKKKGGAWEIVVAQADRWVQSNARRIWNRTNRVAAGESPRSKGSSGRRPGRRRRRAAKPAPAADRNGDLESEDERLRRLDAVLAKFIEQLEGDEVHLDARAVNGVKQISTELRMLDRARDARGGSQAHASRRSPPGDSRRSGESSPRRSRPSSPTPRISWSRQ